MAYKSPLCPLLTAWLTRKWGLTTACHPSLQWIIEKKNAYWLLHYSRHSVRHCEYNGKLNKHFPTPMKFKMSMLWGFSKNSVQNICIAHKMWISFSFLNFESIVLDMHGIYIHCNLKCECVLFVCMCMFSCANTHVHGHTVTHPLNSLTLIYFIWRHFPVEPLSQASLICLEWLTCQQSRVDVWIESLSQVPLEDSIGSMVSHLASCSWFSVEGHDKQWTLFFVAVMF